MKKGKFIVLEGLDASGKSSQIPVLVKRMEEEGLKVYSTRECSDGPIGKLLREVYLPGHRKCDERVINMLFPTDRFDHITNEEDGLLKYLKEGYNVVCDRYYLSSMAYDTYHLYGTEKFDESMEDIIRRNKINIETLQPDLQIFLDVPPKVCMERLNTRNEERSVYEEESKLVKIRESYGYAFNIMVNRYNEKIRIIDGVGSKEEISDRIWNLVRPMFV